MWKLLPYLRNYKKESIIGPLFKLLEACFELIVPLVVANIIDVGIRNQDVPYILKMGGIMILLGVIGLTCSLTAQFFAAKAAVGFGSELRHSMFKHIEELSYAEIDQIGSSTLVTRMTSDINQVQSGVNLVLRLFLRSPFIVVGAMIMAFTISVKIALIFVIAVPVLSLVIYGIMAASIPLYKKVQRGLDLILLSTKENLAGIRVIRAFCTQQSEKEEFEEKSDLLMKMQVKVGKISALMNPVTYTLVNAAILVIVWMGGRQVDQGMITQGQVIALVNYMSQILLALVALANLIISFTKALASAARINDVFVFETSIQSGAKRIGAENAEISKGNIEPDIKVQMDHVDFVYEGSKEAALSDISFAANRGETIGIIGGTGSGKTTLANLIPRFYNAVNGTVFVSGVDVKDYELDALRQKVGIVPQRAVLFHGTIRENMQMGKAHATDEEIYRALDIAQARDVVDGKTEGLDTMISESGKNLSGGQRQRLTIARALVRQPEILIMDASGSALDFATDARLRKAIAGHTDQMTVFIISQRATSIMQADKIIVLDDGHMVGYGTHKELLELCEVYQEICFSQLSKEEVAKHA